MLKHGQITLSGVDPDIHLGKTDRLCVSESSVCVCACVCVWVWVCAGAGACWCVCVLVCVFVRERPKKEKRVWVGCVELSSKALKSVGSCK